MEDEEGLDCRWHIIEPTLDRDERDLIKVWKDALELKVWHDKGSPTFEGFVEYYLKVKGLKPSDREWWISFSFAELWLKGLINRGIFGTIGDDDRLFFNVVDYSKEIIKE